MPLTDAADTGEVLKPAPNTVETGVPPRLFTCSAAIRVSASAGELHQITNCDAARQHKFAETPAAKFYINLAPNSEIMMGNKRRHAGIR